MSALHESLAAVGYSQATTSVAIEAAIAGTKEVLAIHGVSSEDLQIVFKADAGQTPRTVADLRSGKAIRQIIRDACPNDSINEEETGLHKGTEDIWYVDPLDGTSSFAAGQRYSTVGVVAYRDGKPQSAAICHPFEHELLVAESGQGAFLLRLGDHLEITKERPRKLELPVMASLSGGIVFIDALFNAKTSPRKLELMRRLIELSGNNLGFRATGSNIDQQRQIAAGRGQLTITDAVGGFFDLAVGAFIIQQAGGKMVNGQTGGLVTEQTQVAIGGPINIVDQVLPLVQEYYQGYLGFK